MRLTASAGDGNDRPLIQTTDDDNNENRHTVYDWDADGDENAVPPTPKALGAPKRFL